MAQISLSDDLFKYLQQKVEDPNTFVESLLQQWRNQQDQEELAQACAVADELELGWTQEWQQAAITDWEVFGL